MANFAKIFSKPLKNSFFRYKNPSKRFNCYFELFHEFSKTANFTKIHNKPLKKAAFYKLSQKFFLPKIKKLSKQITLLFHLVFHCSEALSRLLIFVLDFQLILTNFSGVVFSARSTCNWRETQTTFSAAPHDSVTLHSGPNLNGNESAKLLGQRNSKSANFIYLNKVCFHLATDYVKTPPSGIYWNLDEFWREVKWGAIILQFFSKSSKRFDSLKSQFYLSFILFSFIGSYSCISLLLT